MACTWPLARSWLGGGVVRPVSWAAAPAPRFLAGGAGVRVAAPKAARGDTPPTPSVVRVCIDLSFSHCTNRELTSVCKQLSICYGMSRRNEGLVLTFSNYGPEVACAVQEKFGGGSWGVERHQVPPWEIHPPEELVYLSPDAGDVLGEVEPEKVYVVGGIVDLASETRNAPGSRERAGAGGVATARLPVRENLPGATTETLNITTVVEALLSRGGGREWAEVIPQVVPRRYHEVSPRKRRTRRSA